MDARATSLIEWIQKNAVAAKGLLVPISGGSDSALCFQLCSLAYPDKTVGIFVGDQLRSHAWFESVGKVLQDQEIWGPAGTHLNREAKLWAGFLSHSISNSQWLVGSRTCTEELLGTFSLASRVATFLPLAGTWKSEVMELCQSLGVPKEITDSSRKADPDCGRPVEMSEIPLELIDLFLKVKVGQVDEAQLKALTEEQILYLSEVYQRNNFRRALPTRGPVLTAPAKQ